MAEKIKMQKTVPEALNALEGMLEDLFPYYVDHKMPSGDYKILMTCSNQLKANISDVGLSHNTYDLLMESLLHDELYRHNKPLGQMVMHAALFLRRASNYRIPTEEESPSHYDS